MSMDQVDYAPVPGSSQRFAVTASANREALSEVMKRPGWIRVLAQGADVDINFGVISSPTPVKDQVGFGTDVGYTVMNGTYHDFWLPGSTHTHCLWASAGNGFVMLTRAGTERVGVTV